MGILDKLKRATDRRSRVVVNDLSRLNSVRRGLGDSAIAYVLDGREETVLSSLSNECKSNPLEVCNAYVIHDSPSCARRQLLARQKPFDPEFTKRYTLALAAACGTLPDSAAGTDKAAPNVRVLFSEAFDGALKEMHSYPQVPVSRNEMGLTLDAAIDIVPELGGSLVDLVDVMYNERSRYESFSGQFYRKVVGVVPLLERHRDDVITAGKRLAAPARANLIQDLYEHKLLVHSDYVAFVLSFAGDGSKAVRETAQSILGTLQSDKLEPLAADALANGNVNMRAGMVDLLAGFGTDSALAILSEHKNREKTARVLAAIDTVFAVSEQGVDELSANDDKTGYESISGGRIEIPPLVPLQDGKPVRFGAEDRAELVAIIDKENVRQKKACEESAKRGYKYPYRPTKHKVADRILEFFNSEKSPGRKKLDAIDHYLTWGAAASWARAAVARLPQKRALELSCSVTRSAHSVLSPYVQGPFIASIRDFVNGPNGDIRTLENLDIALGVENWHGYGGQRQTRKVRKGDFLRYVIRDDYSYMEPQFDNVPPEALWPYLAENLDVIDEAFGIRPLVGDKLNRIGAIKALSRLPEAPARYFGPLLEAATGDTKGGRQEARHMLRDAPNVGGHIIALLDDSRQAIRAGAAEWIAARQETDAIPALKKRLKKEKSEIAKAAILTALDSLGEDLGGFIGPKALLAEAEIGLKKAKFDKLDWLGLDTLPAVRYRNKRRVPDEVLRWWIFLAFKLKQPGGNALFDIYLERLEPKDAETFSAWILDSWVNYDTARPSEAEGNAYANQHAEPHWQYINTHLKKYYPDYTKERAFEEVKRGFMGQYLNTGAATKGLLGLARQAPPAIAADRVRTYLKNHGSRTSQASSLLEVLAGMGDPVALQVVIAAATRLKQKGVQKFAGSLVEEVAEANHWTLDELADRTIPGAGLDDNSCLELPCGEDEKLYTAKLNDSLTLSIRNPDGKTVKALPGGQDDNTKASKKQLSASRRELKQVVTMQTARLYEALCAGRAWPVSDWQRDLYEHPVMRKLTERAVWVGLDGDGNMIGSFRPTAEGDFTDASDEDVTISGFHSVRLAHGAEMSDEDAKAWAGHLGDYEVKSLFVQFGRSLLKIDKAKAADTEIVDRKGWVTDTFTIRGAASKLGYERGEAMDGGYFNEYQKSFQSAGIVAVIEFSGNCLPEENVPAAMMTLSFERYSSGRRMGGSVKLGDVPTVLLSECWNDYRSMVAKGAFDENWEQKMPWM